MQGLICERCGGSYRVESSLRLAVCPYCDHKSTSLDLPVPAAAYEHAVAEQRARAELELVKAKRYRELGRPHLIWLVAAVSVAGVVVLGVVPALMTSEAAILGLVYAPLGALLVSLLLWARLPRASWAEPHALEVHCPLCGGPHRHSIEKALSHCQYCHASLAIDTASATRGLAEADQAVCQAALQHFRESRRWGRGLARRLVWARRLGLVWMPVVPLAAALHYARAEPTESWEGISARAGWAWVSAFVVAGSALFAWRRSRRRSVARARLLPMVEHYGGRWVQGPADIFEWLDVFWLDDYPVYDVTGALGGAAAACGVRGYPALAIVNPNGERPFLELLIAAVYPRSEGSAPLAESPKSQVRLLAAEGFDVSRGPSGVRAALRGSAFKERFNPNLDVAAALGHLAQLVAARGGQPIRPG